MNHFDEWVVSQLGRPFIWGETDCVTLTRAAHELATADQTFRPYEYGSKRAADDTAWLTGGAELMMRNSGWSEVLLADVRSGDVVVMPFKGTDGHPGIGYVVQGRVLTSSVRLGVLLMGLGDIEGRAFGMRAPDEH